jgi:hypothetical protein
MYCRPDKLRASRARAKSKRVMRQQGPDHARAWPQTAGSALKWTPAARAAAFSVRRAPAADHGQVKGRIEADVDSPPPRRAPFSRRRRLAEGADRLPGWT